MKKKLKSLNIKKILSLTMCLMLTLNLGVSNYFVQEANATVTAVAEDPNRELTVNDIPDTKLLNKLTELADANKDGKLVIAELQNYRGDLNGMLNLSNLSLTNIKGLGYAKDVTSIDLSGNSSLNNIADCAFIDCKNLVSIILPDGITTLGISAFEGCTSLKDINLPNGLTNIGEKCFFQCTSLTNIVLPMIISTLGNSAFSGSGLISIEIPNSKVSIGISCFDGCKSLSNVKLPEGIESIPMGCFKAAGISNINLPKSIQTIGEGAFSGSALRSIDLSMCTSLTSIKTSAFSVTPLSNIELPESLTELGSRAFENCSLLPEIKIPSKITVINELTFSKCSNLEKLIFTPSIIDGVTDYKLQEIKSLAFNQCTSLGGVDGNVDFLKDLNKLAMIGDQAFTYCSGETVQVRKDSAGNTIYDKVKDEYGQQLYYGIQSIILPENLTQLGKGVFSYCGSLKTIAIPNKVTVIEDQAFLNCYNLQNVTLSNTLTSIGNNSFESCKTLNNIIFPVSLKKIGSNSFLNCANEKVKNLVGTPNKVYVYTGMDTLILPDNITDIGTGAFRGCFNINTVKLPVNLTQLGDSIFQDCAKQLKGTNGALIDGSYMGLKSVTFPENLASIGGSTFKNCYNLDLVEGKLPYTVSIIGASSFENCNSLTSVVIPYSLKTIGALTFSKCSVLKKVDFGYAANLTSIGSTAFSECTNLDSVNLEYANKLTSIGSSAFNNTSIQGILRLPEKLETIGNGAFQDCKNITSVEFPDGLISVGSLSFKNCENLAAITIPAAATIVCSGTSTSFYGCKSFSNAIIKAVPKDIPIMENSQLTLPVNCLSEINSIEIGDENIATARKNPDSPLKPQVLLNGIKTGQTTITIKGTIQYVSGTDPISGATLVNRVETQVQFNVIVSNIKCTEVKIDQPVKGLSLNNTSGITLKPSITPIDTTDLKKWTSDNISVATVSDTGVVKPVAYGTATIKLTVGDKEAQCTVNVCAPASIITLDKVNETLVIGKQLPISTTLNYLTAYSDIKTNYPDVVIWSSSNPNIATVDQSGNVKAIASGQAVITAKADAGNIAKSCSITVIPEITDVSFDKSEMTLIKGNPAEITKTITMTLNPADSPLNKIKVTSSNINVAAVSVNGNILTVTAKGGGTAIITATPINGKAAVCNVAVKSPLTSITTSPMELSKGSSRTILSTRTPSDTTDKILYSSDNSAVATVDSNGLVKGIAGGIATITMKSENGLVLTTCVVTVKVPVGGVAFTNTGAKLIKNDQLQLGAIATVQPSDATNKALTWSSNNINVAVVDKNGVVTAVGKGAAIISVNTVDGGYRATYAVNVILPSIGSKSIDINNDGKIDIIDLALVANSYNSQLGNSLYRANCDLNSDNIIDVFDIVPVSKYMN